MAQHEFVAMPYGTKEEIDFNAVFRELIEPALENADFEVFRADEEMRAGNIHTDIFQELLLADPVVAELFTDNPTCGMSWACVTAEHGLDPLPREQTPWTF